MQAFGVTAEDLATDVEVWPENTEAVSVFVDLGTQWRHGMNGITGLDYMGVWIVMRERSVPRVKRREVWDQIRVMERAVLEMKAERDG